MEATTETVTQAEEAVALGIETLRGDIRDRILDNIARQMPCWTKLSEHEQTVFIKRADAIALDVVRESTRIAAHSGFPHLVVTLGKWAVKDGIKLEVGADGSVDEIMALANHGRPNAVLVLADPSAFFGQRADAVADKDQPDLPIHDEDGVIAEEGDAGTSESEEQEEGEEEDTEADGPEVDRSPLPEPPAATRTRRRSRESADA
jgi:hypothetical protein